MEKAQTPLHANKHPSPDIELTSYSGNMCPTDSIAFSASDGGLTFTISNDLTEPKESCELHLELTVPAGYRFRRPMFSTGGWALRDDGEIQPSHVSITYGLSDTQLTSEHPLPGATFDDDSDSFLLTDTPQLTVPECTDPNQPMVLDLSVKIDVDIPEGNYVGVISLDGELDLGVQWITCNEHF